MCLSVSQCVCPRIFGNSVRTAGLIGTGDATIDAPNRRNNDGAGRGSIGGTWHVARAAAWSLAKSCSRPYRLNGEHHRSQTRRSHVHYPSLCAFGVAVPVECRLHEPGEEIIFLTWDPPVQGNFELETPNSVHRCILARPTWHRMTYWAGVQCARAVHVQVFNAYWPFPAHTGQTVGVADAKLAGHM